jgi:hypothetical protein
MSNAGVNAAAANYEAYSTKRKSATVIEVLPAPVRPTIPIFSPARMENDLRVMSINMPAGLTYFSRLAADLSDMPSRRCQNGSHPVEAKSPQGMLRISCEASPGAGWIYPRTTKLAPPRSLIVQCVFVQLARDYDILLFSTSAVCRVICDNQPTPISHYEEIRAIPKIWTIVVI